MRITGEQIRAARELIRWRQDALAKSSGLSLPTIKRIEATRGEVSALNETINNIVDALNRAGIEFIEGNNGGPGVRLKGK